jgi:peroxiredoxin
MSLREQLAAMLKLRPERYRSLLRMLAERLKKTAEEGVLKPGDPMPDFVLPDAQGELVFSDDLLKRAPLVVVFFRGDWCPFCRTTLSALNEVAPDIEAAGASIVALTPDTGDYVNAASSGLGLRFPVLSDVDGATALRFGVTYRVPDALYDYWAGVGIDISARHGDSSHLLPLVATFIANRSGVLSFAYASGDITDRVEPKTILAQIRQIADEGFATSNSR